LQNNGGKMEFEELNRIPYSLEAERALIGGIFFDVNSLDEIKYIIKSDDFYKKEHAEIYKAIEKLVKLADKPVLKLVNTNKNELEHSATAKYMLENPTNAEVKSITATLKKGNEIVKTVDLTKDNLDAVLSDLDFYKEYTLSTTIVYNQGNGEKSETLADEKILLEPKKIEVKDGEVVREIQ